MGRTSIEWTDHTVNPIRAARGDGVGHYCEKISAGCKNCYASRLQPRMGMPRFEHQVGAGVAVFLDESVLHQVLRRRKPTRFFWCDMTDLFGSWVPDEWIDRCFATMALTPQHTHQVLTKRPERMRAYFVNDDWVWDRIFAEVTETMPYGHWDEMPVQPPVPLANVHLGVSVENQKAADERIPLLRGTPAAVRFLSMEPLLEHVSLYPVHVATNAIRKIQRDHGHTDADTPQHLRPSLPGLDWVIVGGESGPGARPCELEWIRSSVRECDAVDLPVFVKQIGARPLMENGERYPTTSTKGGVFDEMPLDLQRRELPRVTP